MIEKHKLFAVLAAILLPIAVALAFIFATVPACAAGRCPPDLDGTEPTQPNYNLPGSHPCPDCGEINTVPQDAANAAWNYIAAGLAAHVYDEYFGNADGYGKQTVFTVRIRNRLGQAVNVDIVTNFKTILEQDGDVWIQKRVKITDWRIVVYLPSGETDVTERYYSDERAVQVYPIPADPRVDDGVTPGVDCLDNDGSVRAPSGGGGGTMPGPGGGGGEPTPSPGCGGYTCSPGPGK